jgi:FtsH-binding integral membrane protein
MPNQVMRIVYSTLGALLFGMFLVVDTQMIIGGENKQVQVRRVF